jgi:methylmalonyl-CoA/ethylmalonyl-CoA epimerase
MEFDHAGIATDDLDGLADLYGGLFDATLVHEEEFDGLRVAFLDLGNGYLELLEPLPEADGAIPRYLDEHGPGIHHLALRTDDVAAALDVTREAGVDLVDEEPRPGVWGHDVAFLHPASTGGVLVEFVEH